MTRERVIQILEQRQCCRECVVENCTCTECDEAFDMAIKVIKQESVLDKIRSEILEEKECAYADFERYKAEYLGQDPEDVLDSLPQDEFRYGMERTIELIDKYRAENEGEK